MKICLNTKCKVEFKPNDYRQKYCSRSCAATVNGSRYPKRGDGKPRYCIECNKQLSHNQRKWCSKKCNGLGQKNETIRKWLSGESSGGDKNGHIGRPIRDYIIELAGTKCIKCGWCEPNPITGKTILAVDHIDGNWRNNDIDNLQVLCYNCHTLTETFGALNIGSGNGSGSRGGKFNSWSYSE